jgi:hypothetical protein
MIMPEQISKYPDVTLQVLRESGAVCGQGAPQNILKQCPRDRFCSLRTGEICVYGINDIPKMTQITSQELAKVVCPRAEKAAVFSAGISGLESVLILAVFLSGLAAGKYWQKPRWRVSRRRTNSLD